MTFLCKWKDSKLVLEEQYPWEDLRNKKQIQTATITMGDSRKTTPKSTQLIAPPWINYQIQKERVQITRISLARGWQDALYT